MWALVNVRCTTLLRKIHSCQGDGKALLEGKLNSIFEKWSALSSSTTKNLIYNAKISLGGGGYVNSILKLKKGLKYDYIQDSRFPGQGSDLVYLFKMSTTSSRSGVDLVKRMEPGGDLVF